MDTENNTPESEGKQGEENEKMKLETRKVPASADAKLPVIRTFHRDADATKGESPVGDFTPTRPSAPSAKEEVTKKEEGVPQQASGFVPPTQLHRVQETHARPERKTPEIKPEEKSQEKEPGSVSRPPTSALKKEPKKTIVRTYEDDSARAMREKKGSLASIAVAEQKRRQSQLMSQGAISPWKKHAVRALTSLLFIVGIGIVGYAVWQTRPPEEAELLPDQSIIFAEQVQHEEVSDLSIVQLQDTIQAFMSHEIPLDAIRELRLVRTTRTEEETIQTPITPEIFLESVGLERRAPLARALGERIMIAASGTPDTEAILIADVVSYDSAFASMIRWEQSILEDLDFLIPPSIVTGTSSATTTLTGQEGFIDVIIENRDVRILYDENGKIQLLYSFPTTNTLVITTNDNVYRDVLERLGRRTFTR